MSRASRFDKLENERRPATEQKSGASLERFGEAPAPSPREGQAPGPAAALDRFSSDGSDAVRTNEDELAALPFLVCPACGGQAGKFDVSCFNCGTRLDTREARAHNLERLKGLEAERAEEQARVQARREAEIADAAQLRQSQRAVLEKQLDDIKRAHGGGNDELIRYVGVWIAVVVSAVLAMQLSGGPRFFFVLLTLVLVATRLPAGVWRALGKHIERR
ncbi:MAG: hypothetical protein AMXMBFR34_19700 [Myxococcaceae bacterium]